MEFHSLLRILEMAGGDGLLKLEPVLLMQTPSQFSPQHCLSRYIRDVILSKKGLCSGVALFLQMSAFRHAQPVSRLSLAGWPGSVGGGNMVLKRVRAPHR